jgi:hypothetical protein
VLACSKSGEDRSSLLYCLDTTIVTTGGIDERIRPADCADLPPGNDFIEILKDGFYSLEMTAVAPDDENNTLQLVLGPMECTEKADDLVLASDSAAAPNGKLTLSAKTTRWLKQGNIVAARFTAGNSRLYLAGWDDGLKEPTGNSQFVICTEYEDR